MYMCKILYQFFNHIIYGIITALITLLYIKPILVAARCKTWAFGRTHAGFASLNPTGVVDVFLL